MLLRIRVRLPDRPGSLGKVARILGAAGADVVQMTVLERDGGRALDDFTVAWPAGVSIDRLIEGLGFIPGVDVEGVWPTIEPQGAFPDAALIGQLAAEPGDGLAIFTDALPGILSADWAWLLRATSAVPLLVHASTGAGAGFGLPDIKPIRPRAFAGADGTNYALAPIGGLRTGLVILVARTAAPRFHGTEVFRLTQLVGAAEAVLGPRLGQLAAAVAIALG
jgi:ACT domain-containing protein